jgi:hypothetical protein
MVGLDPDETVISRGLFWGRFWELDHLFSVRRSAIFEEATYSP